MSDESENPGLLLKEARERMGLSVNDVSTSTKINPSVLKALEEGRLDDLPPRTFTRGFVRSYAQYLKIDPMPIIKGFDLEDPFITSMGKTNSEAAESPRAERRRSDFNASSLGPRVLLMAGIIALILMIIGVKKVVDRYAKESIPPESAQTESGTPIITSGDEIVLSEEDAEAKAVADALLADDPELQGLIEKAKEKEVAALKPTDVPPTMVPPTAAPTPSPVPTAVPTVAPTATPTPTEKPKEKEAEATPTPKPVAASHEVIIEALKKTEFEVSLDDSRGKDVELSAGDLRIFKAVKSVEFDFEDAGAVNVIYNGRNMGVAGEAGKSVDLKFPK